MPYKANQPRRHKIPRARYKVRNWPAYDRALQQRGSLSHGLAQVLKPAEGLSQSFGVYPALSMRAAYAPPNRRWPMILNAIAEKLKRRSKDDFKGRHFEAAL